LCLNAVSPCSRRVVTPHRRKYSVPKSIMRETNACVPGDHQEDTPQQPAAAASAAVVEAFAKSRANSLPSRPAKNLQGRGSIWLG
jgi:hypothetical protein